ncbi:MAG TPA: hypothetical protein VMD02_02900 [Candidatus Omnitrophota bacterium]|nr:hypothetical protein [Candidatus Omnitrophota bacterium]
MGTKQVLVLLAVIIAIGVAAVIMHSVFGQKISVVDRPEAKLYSVPDIPISLEIDRGINEGVWRTRSDSGLPLNEQITALDHLLARALSDGNKPPHTLSIGRLEEAFGKDRTMSDRLIQEAKSSPLWDKKKGKAANGDDNGAVAALIDKGSIAAELASLFKKHGLELHHASVEKVLVNGEKLPFDCQTWFRVKKVR